MGGGVPLDAEIGIVGGGPAGARAAELLAGMGADVVVWDPRVPWEKPCGGGLSASTFDLVPELGPLKERGCRVEAVRFEAPANRDRSEGSEGSSAGFPVLLERPMFVVSRRDLSAFQASRAVAAGATWIDSRVRGLRRSSGFWEVSGGDGESWRVARLVGADGAASRVRPLITPDLKVELAPTRVAYPDGPAGTPDTLLVRLFDEVDGYFWDFSRPDHRSVGAGVEPGCWNRARLDGEIDGYLGGALEVAPEGRPDQGTVTRAGAVIGTAALGHGRFEELGDEGFALLGDAAGLADPATGEGIQNALRSASYLADAYAAERTFASYPRRVRAAMSGELRRSRILRRLLFEAGWGSWLVRRGHGDGDGRWARAAVSAVMNSVNEHDVRVPGLLRRGASFLRGRRLRG